jgi:hypothetical protein
LTKTWSLLVSSGFEAVPVSPRVVVRSFGAHQIFTGMKVDYKSFEESSFSRRRARGGGDFEDF